MITALIMAFFAGMSPVCADDYGNTPALSTLITTGAVGHLETDLDRDWFRFLAAPSMVYTIQVNNISLWDNAFSVKAFADGSDLRNTNSAFISSPSRIVWTNTGGQRHYFVGVSALFEFATGTYAVAVNQYADSDGDGMADAWEIRQFGSLTNSAAGDVDGDRFSNRDEYMAGTQPTNLASFLAITNFSIAVTSQTIRWPAVSFGTYRVEISTNLLQTGSWIFTNRVRQASQPGPLMVTNALSTNLVQHHRVVYEIE